ncbi:MAG TPA: FAD:protein FMN transferase, partial [Devosiaceae bacterium]|nr:FAD:protein FMN transferase [Devosiaceae bacterium]
MNRRRVLKIAAVAAAVPAGVFALRALQPGPRFFTWTGVALGGEASLTLWHADAGFAERTMARMLAEVTRLEGVFSLFRSDSEISRLNAGGALSGPSPDLVAVLDSAAEISAASGGAFDVTVQPLWRLYQDHFRRPGADPAGPPAGDIAAAVAAIDFTAVQTSARAVRLGRPGASVTLNGIAQGYITDRIADLLRNEGFDHVVVELGETRVLGTRPDGRPWQIGIRDGTGSAPNALALTDRALAVSAGYGTVFETSGQSHHIFDPGTGRSPDGAITVAVAADRATIADGLSTAIVVAGETRAPALLAAYSGAQATIVRG